MLIPIVALLITLATATPAFALPSSVADNGVYMVNGPRVDDIVRVGANTWIGGNFSQVQNGSGANVASASGLTVFNSAGTLISSINSALPNLGGSNRDVYDLSLAPNGTLYAAGTFTYSVGGKTYGNLIGIDPSSGSVVAKYSAPALKSVLATSSYVYAGGSKLQRYPLSGGGVTGGWHTMTAFIDDSLRPHSNSPSFREIDVASATQLIVVGQFDSIDGTDASHQKKVAVMVSTATGQPDLGTGSWTLHCGCASQSGQSFGLAVEVAGGVAYIAAGGNDWVGAVNISNGNLVWQTDTNGSAQDVALFGTSQVIVGGHFTSIELSGSGDQNGSECPERNSASQAPCLLQPRLAAISRTTGLADASWKPSVCCQYLGVWATMVDGSTVHVGGEFTRLDNDPGPEDYYGRFS
jgi:hypothetical protein